jgi:hypothetical protein
MILSHQVVTCFFVRNAHGNVAINMDNGIIGDKKDFILPSQ